MKAIVIGAGFAGLAAALRLRKEGLDVLVLEQQSEVGGKAIGWEGIPTGPTLLALPDIARSLFLAFEADPPLFEAVSPITRFSWPDGKQIAPQTNLEATLAQLSSQEAADYQRLLGEAQAIFEGICDNFIYGNPPSRLDLGRYALHDGLKGYLGHSLEQLVQSGPYLTQLFLQLAADRGANPFKAPAVLHHLSWTVLGLGLYQCEGGMRVLADALYALAQAQGVEFQFNQSVEQLLPDANRVNGLRSNHGWFNADIYISAADAGFTQRWLGQTHPQNELGFSNFSLLLHLNEAVPLGQYVYFSKDYPREWQQLEAGHLATEPTFSLYTNGLSAVFRVAAPNLQRLKTSEGELEQYASMLLSRLQTVHPLAVGGYRAMTPKDYALGAYAGAIYGLAPHGLMGLLRPGWKVGAFKNLIQVGGTVHPGGGVPMALLSGWNGAGWLAQKQ